MKICIPTSNDEGINSKVYGHFGSAPFFIVYDTENAAILVIDNRDKEHEHGHCNPLASFNDTPIDIMVTGGIGMRALQRLNASGVKAYRSTTENTVADVVEHYRNGVLEEISLEDSCAHHNCS